MSTEWTNFFPSKVVETLNDAAPNSEHAELLSVLDQSYFRVSIFLADILNFELFLRRSNFARLTDEW